MAESKFAVLKTELATRAEIVRSYILSETAAFDLQPPELHHAATDYLKYGGKMLRPGVLLFSCAAVGGDEAIAIPAAAATELYHTWTLVHDDIIDQDAKRRGQPTVHEKYANWALNNSQLEVSEPEARHLGTAIGILAGDVQHGWAIRLMTHLFYQKQVKPELVLLLIREMETLVLNKLVSGETLDVVFSKSKVEVLSADQIMAMLWGKTGALYEFAGISGALLGLNSVDMNHPYVTGISTFMGRCGVAFQLQDDILGVVGDEKKLGKPVGSDLREGKKTIILYHCMEKATPTQKKLLLKTLGQPNLSTGEIEAVVELMYELGGIQYTRQLANDYLDQGLTALEVLPESRYKKLLRNWAEFLIEREY